MTEGVLGAEMRSPRRGPRLWLEHSGGVGGTRP